MKFNSLLTRILFWSLVSGLGIALFWTIFVLLFGFVPTINDLTMRPVVGMSELPINFSCWWSIVLGPFVSANYFVYMHMNEHLKEDADADKYIEGIFITFLFCDFLGLLATFGSNNIAFGLLIWLAIMAAFNLCWSAISLLQMAGNYIKRRYCHGVNNT